MSMASWIALAVAVFFPMILVGAFGGLWRKKDHDAQD